MCSTVETLTPARALMAELVRRYWVLGIECSLLEVQKLAWLMERRIVAHGLENPLKLEFQPHRYGPYSDRLRHLLHRLVREVDEPLDKEAARRMWDAVEREK